MLSMGEVSFGYPRRAVFLHGVSFDVERGSLFAIVGPNGAGKTTLLNLAAGLIRPGLGSVRFEGALIQSISLRERSKRIALLPQHPPTDVTIRAADVVLMGRYPHRSLGLFDSAEDHAIVEEVMNRTETLAFADRAMNSLSGGEAQRVHLAAALAQQPRMFLLDEPTASLDLDHQQGIFGILRREADEQGLSVVVVTHDLNIASHYADRVLLLHDGAVVAMGAAADVLSSENLLRAYHYPITEIEDERFQRKWLVPMPEGRVGAANAAETGGGSGGGGGS